MNPAKVHRDHLVKLTDLPNIGPAMAQDLQRLGMAKPAQLVSVDPFDLYSRLCRETDTRQDPCVLDVFMSITRFTAGDEAQPWWAYTGERKALYGQRLRANRDSETP